MDVNGDAEDTATRIQARFVTKLEPPFKVPATSIALPSNLTRLGLSTVVNNLLQAGTLFRSSVSAIVVFLVCSEIRVLRLSIECLRLVAFSDQEIPIGTPNRLIS